MSNNKKEAIMNDARQTRQNLVQTLLVGRLAKALKKMAALELKEFAGGNVDHREMYQLKSEIKDIKIALGSC